MAGGSATLVTVAGAGTFVRVSFDVEVDGDAGPAAGDRTESLWAEDLGDGTYRLEGTPLFAHGCAAGDVVEAMRGEDGVLRAVRTVLPSGRMTIRVRPADGHEKPVQRATLQAFAWLGIRAEGHPDLGLVLLDVAADADHAAIAALLRQGEAMGVWAVDEGCVTSSWPAP